MTDPASRPRLLLFTDLTELEWAIQPLLEEWAEVASFDAPGVGDEPPSDLGAIEAITGRGLEELDRRGWDRCVMVADEMAIVPALRAAAERPDAVAGMALGHPCLRYDDRTTRPEMLDAWLRTLRTNYAMLVRQDVRSWNPGHGAALDDDAAEALVRNWLARVEPAAAERLMSEFLEGIADLDVGAMIRAVDAPLLFAEHVDCIGWTPESFADAHAAFPEAAVVSCDAKPALSPEFAAALRGFCAQLRG